MPRWFQDFVLTRAIRRRYIELRYELLPYVYTNAEEMARTGSPMMRPLFLEYPKAEKFYGESREFLFGGDLLVAPAIEESRDGYEVRFPPGEWYEYWTSEKLVRGQRVHVNPALDALPLYVRAGAILAQQPLVQSTDETPSGALQLHVYPGEDCRGALYLDDGHTFAYKKGEYLRVNYTCQTGENSLRIKSSARLGSFMPWWSNVQVTVFGSAHPPREVRAGNQVLNDWHYDAKAKAVTLVLPDSATGWELLLME